MPTFYGRTPSSSFPSTSGSFDPSHNGQDDAFVVKLNPAGSGLLYATFLGGSGGDAASVIAVDAAGSAYVAGDTTSSNFPSTPGSFDPSHNGSFDAFVVKLNPAGSGLVYATFLGGSSQRWRSCYHRGSSGKRLCDRTYRVQRIPHHPRGVRPELTTVPADFVTKLNRIGERAGLRHLPGGWRLESNGEIAVDGDGQRLRDRRHQRQRFSAQRLVAFDPSYNGGYSTAAWPS